MPTTTPDKFPSAPQNAGANARHDMRQIGVLLIAAAFVGFFIEQAGNPLGALALVFVGVGIWWFGLGRPKLADFFDRA